MNNKRVKGWHNVDKVYAEYKQAIQRSRIDQFILIVKGSVRVLKFVGIGFQSLDEAKAKVEVPQLLFALGP